MTIPRRTSAPRRKRSPLRFLFTFSLTVAMLATGGFGVFPNNPLTDMYQKVLSENIPEDFLAPFNTYMESLSASTIPPSPDPVPDGDPTPDLLSALAEILNPNPVSDTLVVNATAAYETAVASILETQTAVIPIRTLTPLPTNAYTPTFTPLATSSPLPTSTFLPLPLYPVPTKTRVKIEEPTVSPKAALSGFNANAVTLNNLASPLPVRPGAAVSISWTFDVFDDQCPTCTTQLVTGLGGSHGGVCAFDTNADLSPGVAGSETISVNAPMTYGTYNIVVELHHKAGGCAEALAAYGTGTEVLKKNIGIIHVQPLLVLYEAGVTTGNIGSRSAADALCAANLPSGYTNYRAFIGYSSADSIANIPANYGFSSSVAIQSPSGKYVANNWADLMDGSISDRLQQLDVVSSGNVAWWSGVEASDGSFIDGVTKNCNNWTSDLDTVGGTYGMTSVAISTWLKANNSAGCQQYLALLCVGD